LPQRRPILIFLALVVVCLIWGSTWLAIRINLKDFPPLRGAGLRFLLAAALIAISAGRRRLPRDQQPPTRYWLGLSLVLITIPYASVYWGEQFVSSGLTAVLFATYPQFVALLAHSGVHGERLTPSLGLGLLSGLGGVTVLFWGELGSSQPGAVGGGLLILLAALSSAGGTIMLKRRLAHLDPLLINLRPMLYGGLILMALSLLTEGATPWTWSLRGTGTLLYLSVFGSAVAFSLYCWLMRTLPVSRLSFIVYVTPVIALLLGAMVEGESMTWRLLLGTALIIGGISLSRRGGATRVA
jgi:drug/metabolite transporter (DMT)-like permease